jgi:hypothetical protein
VARVDSLWWLDAGVRYINSNGESHGGQCTVRVSAASCLSVAIDPS